MHSHSLKRLSAIILVLAALGIGAFVIFRGKAPEIVPVVKTEELPTARKVIGQSVEGRAIEAYAYGSGATHLVFVGGIHGGYEWNSVLLAYMFMDYLVAHPEIVPKNLTIDVIPSANPDGVYKVTGKEGRFAVPDVSTDKTILASGRFNARAVDLNRNFDCKWQSKSTWQSKTVSAGEAPFSEPEAATIRSFMLTKEPASAVFWHSQANGVYASQCEKGILPETVNVMNAYAKASGYPPIKTFDAYAVTGASEDWLASVNIPAITVELKTHDAIEFEKNLAGIKALLAHFGRDL